MAGKNEPRRREIAPSLESFVRRWMSQARGTPFIPLGSLEEARLVPEGTVILEGDEGGQIYLTCPACMARCSEEDLRHLAEEIDALQWDSPRSAHVYYERLAVGQGIAGGMGGGLATGDLWLHPRLAACGIEPNVARVLAGEQAGLGEPTDVLLERAKAVEPDAPHWRLRLARRLAAKARAAQGDTRRVASARALAEYEGALSAGAHPSMHLLMDVGRVALDAGKPDIADRYLHSVIKEAWRGVQQRHWWGEVMHDAYVGLGRAALTRGDIASAAGYLEEAGKVPWTATLQRRGPDLSLARELAELGEWAAVESFIATCERFWENGRVDLARWREATRARRLPPDLGPGTTA